MLKKKFWLVLPLMAILLSGCSGNTVAQSEGPMLALVMVTGIYLEAHHYQFPDMSTPATVKAALLPYVSKEVSEDYGTLAQDNFSNQEKRVPILSECKLVKNTLTERELFYEKL